MCGGGGGSDKRHNDDPCNKYRYVTLPLDSRGEVRSTESAIISLYPTSVKFSIGDKIVSGHIWTNYRT